MSEENKTDRIIKIFLLAISYYAVSLGTNLYTKSEIYKADHSHITIENLQKANDFFKDGYYRYKGKYIQSEFENKHLRTDSAKALRFTVTVYDNKY